MNKPVYEPIEYIALKEAVEVIIESGGVPVLVHPQKKIGLDEEVFRQYFYRKTLSSFHPCSKKTIDGL